MNLKRVREIVRHWMRPTSWAEMFFILRRDAFVPLHFPGAVDAHLHASVDWLLAAHAVMPNKGFSATYSFVKGWNRSYPETTGYIIPTLLNFLSYSDYRSAEIRKACIAAGKWLLSLQRADGSFGELFEDRPAGFDTGQILFGLLALADHTGDGAYTDAARRAADWLVANQWENGVWGRFERGAEGDHEFTHNARIAWALLAAAKQLKAPAYGKAAERHLNWVVEQQQNNGWFNHSYFTPGNESFLHTIAYTLDGLVNGGIMTKNDDFLAVADRTLSVLLDISKRNKLKSYYDSQWNNTDHSYCLTGLSQVSVLWKKLHPLFPDRGYDAAAANVDRFVSSKQIMRPAHPRIHGGIGGSFPIWGRFVRMNLVNWAVKFHIDALLLGEEARQERTIIKYHG